MATVQELEATVATLITVNQQLDEDNKRALDTIQDLQRENHKLLSVVSPIKVAINAIVALDVSR